MTPYPATTGCDQLSFNPSLFAQPTTTATDTASGIDIDIKVPQDLSADSPSPSQIRDSTVTLPQRGSRSTPMQRTARKPARTLRHVSEPKKKAQCPENAKIGTVQVSHADPPRPAAWLRLSRGTEAGRTLPSHPCRRRLQRSRQASRHGQPRPADRAADGHVQGPAAVPVLGLQHAPLRCRARDPRDADGMRNLPGQQHLHSVGFAPTEADLGAVLHGERGSGRQGMPGSTRPFGPSLEAGVTDKTAGKHAPFVLKVIQRRRRSESQSS